MFVADSHAWLWHLTEDERLGDDAEKILESVDDGEKTVIIPSIVVAESIYVAKSHGYGIEMEKIVDDLKVSNNYRMKSLDHRLTGGLSRDKRELSIHDKIIVLTAEQTGADIISQDREITSLANTNVIW